MGVELIPAHVSQEVWRMAEDRCQCTLPGCHDGAGRCAARLDSGGGRVCLLDPRGPSAVWNCILLCTRCLETLKGSAWPD